MTASAHPVRERRLVCTTGSSNKEYVGIVAQDANDPAVFYGYCRWGRIDAAARQTAVYYKGPSFNDAHDVVAGKLEAKLRGRSRYVREDDGPVFPLREVGPIVADIPVPTESPVAAGPRTHRGMSPNVTVADIMRRRRR